MKAYLEAGASLLMVLVLACGTGAAEPWKAKDLNPVTCRKALDHPPLSIPRLFGGFCIFSA